MKTRILIIDEDQEQLRRYQEALEPKSTNWEVTCVDSAERGLELAKTSEPELVIASYTLDENRGIEYLTEIERLLPNTQRFITATDADKPKLENHTGSFFQFLPNPCPANRLITEIQRSLAIDTWLGNPKIKEIIAKMGEFPSLPPLYLKVVNALNSHDASTEQISQAISADLAISAKVLQTVNSSYYGFEDKISDITHAVSILGVECVKNLVLAVQVFNKLGNSPTSKSITDQLWHHSMSVAVAAKRIAAFELEDDKVAEEAYTAGLMHDLGKLVLLNAIPETFEAARERSREAGISLWQAEEEIIGCNHAEIGAYLLGRWGMPAAVVEAVALHHEPVNSFGTRFSTLAAVHIANAIVWERQSVEHPDAQPDQGFLVEIGKSDNWTTWQVVATGKAVVKPAKPKLRKSEESADNKPRPLSRPIISDPENSSEQEGERQESNGLKLAPIGIALAACLGVAACIYLLKTSESDAEFTHFPEESPAQSELAQTIEKAREISGISQTEDALEEIFDAQEQAEPAEANQVAEAIPESEETAETLSPAEPEVAEVAIAPEPVKVSDPVDAFPQIQLSGIFFNDENPLASINGKIRRVGDTVSGAQIISINQRQVVVRYDDQLRTYKLN